MSVVQTCTADAAPDQHGTNAVDSSMVGPTLRFSLSYILTIVARRYLLLGCSARRVLGDVVDYLRVSLPGRSVQRPWSLGTR